MKFLIVFLLAFVSFPPRVRLKSAQGLRNCVGNEHVTGKWIYDNRRDIKKSFICCTHNHVQTFVDPTYCFPLIPKFNKSFETKFRYNPNQGSDEFFMFPEGDGCTCDLNEGSYSVHNRERYYWKPARCDLPRWNATDFCRLLSNRRILVLGDSTGLQTFATLANMVTSGQGGCATQIRYDWSTDLKQTGGHDCFVCGSNDISQSIQSQPVVPDIVIILSGAHVPSIEAFQEIWKVVDRQLRQVHDLYPKMKFVYKSQNPGHPNCSPKLKPTQNIPIIRKHRYHWHLHPEYERISLEKIKLLQSFYHPEYQNLQNHSHQSSAYSNNESHFVPFIQYLDMAPLLFRPDAHSLRDCLHYCTPGPLDLFSILLYNKLINGEL
jgi:hypothetical protein